MPSCALVSFRLGGTDGVSIVAESWRHSLTTLGFTVTTIAGEGPVDDVARRAGGSDDDLRVHLVDLEHRGQLPDYVHAVLRDIVETAHEGG